MRVLIVGTTGQLATELRREPTPSNVQLLAPDRFDLAVEPAISAALERARPDLVLNAAAYTAVDKAEVEPERAFALNARGPELLASWCRQNGATLLHVSTDYVFDGSKTGPYLETDVTAPMNVYGASKLAGEEAIRQVLPEHLVIRTSWVFSSHGQNFVKTMLRLAGERDELRVVADQRGRPTSARALAQLLWQLAQRVASGKAPPFGTYHFASAGETTWHGFAQAIVEQLAARTGRQVRVVPIATSDYPTPARRPLNSVLDCSKVEQLLGAAIRPWRDELRSVLQELVAT